MPNNESPHIFISHATADDDFVRALRIKLELQGLNVWVDSRNLRGGDRLRPEIEQAIGAAGQVCVVLSPQTINSAWVRQEIQLAEQVAKENKEYRIIPLLLPGVEPSALALWFDEAPVGIMIQLDGSQLQGQLQEKMPEILAALGERLPDDLQPPAEVAAKPVAELLLELYNPKLTQRKDGAFQLSSEAELEYIPADTRIQPQVKSRRFRFISPIGRIEQDDLRWYLERYPGWPTGLFRQRAQAIEAGLPKWGRALFDAVLDNPVCREAITGWQQAREQVERLFSIRVDAALLEGAGDEEQATALEAASKLLSLPWELLHDGKGYLSEGAHPVSLRRRLPNYENRLRMVMQLPIRILLASPRPEEEGVGYIDHRASALPLVDAVESLGDLVELRVLTPPTLAALERELKRARDANQPYQVLHFDGHGIYDPRHGLGALCFEDPKDSHKPQQRGMQLVYANDIASLLRDYRIPLVFLEACQTGQSEADPNASVAASLLQAGVASVIAMSHSVLVKSASLFVTAVYGSLAQGRRVGQAMLEGQRALMRESFRYPIPGAGELHMQDWFVPILYQEQHDPQLFKRIPSERAEKMQAQQQQARLGQLPERPPHTFIGRSRELLTLERLLQQQPYAVIRGQGGIGKSTLAVELARWLVCSRRFDRCAFVSLEAYSHDRALLDELGRQLCGNHYSVAEYGDDLTKALQPVRRVLENDACLLLLDNMETLLANEAAAEPVLQLASDLLAGGNKTRLLFTTREALPAPFDDQARERSLGALEVEDAKALVMRVMANEGLELKHDDEGRTPEEVDKLVNTVHGHARALVLLARELSRQGVTGTTQNLQRIMRQLEQRHPGERELSLFASVELSLQRLSAEAQALVKGLAVLHDGGDIAAIAYILEIDRETAGQFAAELIQVGLAEAKAYDYLCLDPALPHYLGLQLQAQEKQPYRQRWSEAIAQLVDYLYQQKFEDTKLAAQLTQLELPNLMAYLRGLEQLMQARQAEPEQVAGKAGSIEQLLEFLDYPQALAEVAGIRRQAAERLGHWSHALFETGLLTIERLLDQGDLQQALEAAQRLLQQCGQAGTDAYPGADYDLTTANFMLGRLLSTGGAAAEALPLLQQAQQSFEAVGEQGAGMASVSLAKQGDCLQEMGRLDEAAAAYQEGIKRAEKLEDTRGVAVKKGQLASVRLLQKEYSTALQGHREALELFQQLDEPDAVATAWHKIGMVYREQALFDEAESACRKSLTIWTRRANRAGEAGSLNELANLYDAWNRPEQAVDYYGQAADIFAQLGDKRYEGFARGNLADTLIRLNRLNEARLELLRGINCLESFGHAAEPWTAWNILRDLEQAGGNPQAAREARQQALQAYLAYRRDGGENHSGAGRLCFDLLQAMQQGETAEMEQVIAQLLEREAWQAHKAFLHRLHSILAGDRNPALAEDEEMHYQYVVELKLLLEQSSRP